MATSRPVAGTDAADNHAAVSSQDAAQQRPRAAAVLVIEDEDTLRIAVSKLLGKAGISVMEAADGSSALEKIRGNEPIDVVILDLTIPGAPSREVFAEITRLRPEARIFVTSAHPEEFAVKSLDGPIRYFIRKPYRVADVLAMIRHATS